MRPRSTLPWVLLSLIGCNEPLLPPLPPSATLLPLARSADLTLAAEAAAPRHPTGPLLDSRILARSEDEWRALSDSVPAPVDFETALVVIAVGWVADGGGLRVARVYEVDAAVYVDIVITPGCRNSGIK